MPQYPQFSNVGGAVGKLGPAVIGAGVINIDDLESAPLQRGADFLDKRADIASLIHDRNENRNLDRGWRDSGGLGFGHEDTLGRGRNNGMGTCVSLPTHAARVKRAGPIQEN